MRLDLPESPNIFPTLRLDLHLDRMDLPLEFLVNLFTLSHVFLTRPSYDLVDGDDGSRRGGDCVRTGGDGEIRFRAQTAVRYAMTNLSRYKSLQIKLTSQTVRKMS